MTDAEKIEALGDELVAVLSGRLSFDRFNIGLIDQAAYEFIDAYVSGRNVAGRETGHRRTLEGTVVEAAIDAGEGAWFGGDPDALLARFPRFGPVLDSGIRAMLSVPLRREGRVVAALVLASHDPDGFDDAALATVQEVGAEYEGRITARAGVDY